MMSFTLSSCNMAEGLSAVVKAVNDQSAKTGITAALNSNGSRVLLNQAKGNGLLIPDTNTPNPGTVSVQKLDGSGAKVDGPVVLAVKGAADNSRTMGYVPLDSEKSFSITPTTTNMASAGALSLQTMKNLGVTTFATATSRTQNGEFGPGFHQWRARKARRPAIALRYLYWRPAGDA